MRALVILFFGLALVGYGIGAGVITSNEGLAFTTPDIKWTVICLSLAKYRQPSKSELEYLRLRQQYVKADAYEELTDTDLAGMEKSPASRDQLHGDCCRD